MIPGLIDRFLSSRRGPLGAHYNGYKEWRWGDPHIRLLKILCDKRRATIDVGAHTGAYTYFLRRYSSACFAFEPNPTLAVLLKTRFPTVHVHAMAVSDRTGSAVLRIPVGKRAPDAVRATIDEANALRGEYIRVEKLTVPVLRLDDVIAVPVGMIKIDVEGHELSVLRGCERILRRDKPNIIVELEERHHPGIVQIAHNHLMERGYRGWFLFKDDVVSCSGFSLNAHQCANAGTSYVWNFVFSVDVDAERKLRNASARTAKQELGTAHAAGPLRH